MFGRANGKNRNKEVIDMDISNAINAVKVSGSSSSSVKKILIRTSGN
jgi:hypothetical protein